MLDTLTPDQQILKDPTNPADTSVNSDVNTPLTPEEIQAQQDKAKAEQEAKDDEIDRLLKVVMKKAEEEDEDLRYPMLCACRRNDLYFNNIQKIFYDSVARDIKTLDSVMETLGIDGLDDIKTVNVYRAFAESIIAALTVAPPPVEFVPDDAEDPDDIQAAEAYSKISEVVSKHNHAQLMLIKAATTLFNCGVIFGYNYYKSDPAYGVVKTPSKTESIPHTVVDVRCRNCAELIDSGLSENELPQQPVTCPFCKETLPPTLYNRIEHSDEVTEYESTPKGRSAFDLFGPTYVKASLYARNQAALGYLVLRIEDHIAKFKSVYKDFKDDITAGGGDTLRYERWARVPLQYEGTIPQNVTTSRTAWFRPWYYNVLEQEEDIQILQQEYPEGVRITMIGDVIVEKKHERLDDKWTVTFDPRANFIHAEPAGNALIPLQDAETDIFNLGLQSIEFGIPETFVHPKTLNIRNYSKQRNAPGMLTSAMPPSPDKTLADGFHTVKTATLSNEYTTFASSIEKKTQFVTGAFPSIFGGAMAQGGDTTATEYTESKSRAMQRIQLPWQMLSVFWTILIYKCVKDYAQNLREDEYYSKKENGTFVNVWIRKSELNGKVGEVEPEINGQIPQSWAQKKDFFMSLVQMNNPEIGAILMHPNNAENVKMVTGMPDFYIPGENDRNKQFAEYYELVAPGAMPNGSEPSVPIDLDVDDHPIHMIVLKNILVGLQGLQLYKTNPDGYSNCIAHYRAHEMAQQAKTQSASGLSAPGQPAETVANTTQG